MLRPGGTNTWGREQKAQISDVKRDKNSDMGAKGTKNRKWEEKTQNSEAEGHKNSEMGGKGTKF